MKILLTGATGFLGKRLLQRLVNDGHKVIVLVRHTADLKSISSLFYKIDVHYIENDGIKKTFTANPDIDAIVHAATDYSHNSPFPTTPFWANVDLPVRLLELAIEYKIASFINLDTFFNSKKSNYEYLGGYTLSKRHFQEWGEYTSNKATIGFANLRIFHVYGPNDGDQKFVTTIVKKCLAGEKIDLTSGEQKRDFIYVEDVVDAIGLVVSTNLGCGYHHFDVGSGASMRIRDFVETVNRLCGNRATLNFGVLETRKGELLDFCADISRLRSLGWVSRMDIDAGILTIINAATHHDYQLQI